MTLNGRIADPNGDRIERQERADRFYEKADYFGEGARCGTCGCIPTEVSEGLWACVCCLPVGVAR